MRFVKILIMALLCLNFTLVTQSDILNHKVSLHYQGISIENILKNIHEKYGVSFSYLNNEIPADTKLDLDIENKPLYMVLDEILKDTNLSYQVVSGQVVLKKDINKALQENTQKAQTEHKNSGMAKPDPEQPTTRKQNTVSENAAPKKEAKQATDPVAQAEEEAQEPAPVQQKEQRTKPVEPVRAKENDSATEKQDALVLNSKSPSDLLSEKINRGLDQILFQHIPDESDYEERPFHFGIIYPLSTNGTEAGRYVNKISLHLIAGYAAGLDGFEASGFGNLENDFVKGGQFAGCFNIVKNNVEGIQASGFLNVNGGNMRGAQFAGFLNTDAGELNGIQGAGFANITTGFAKGAQLAGFMNVVSDSAKALQGAGFINVTTGFHKGAQLAGFANIANSAKGIQLAGFTNVVAGDVDGFQGSGFINVARNVKGVQLSVFNVADSIDGVPIGFLSIVRKNGYRRLEVWGSEALQANIGFKIGVERFYNIFAAGTRFTDTNFRWGLGYGIGTQWPSSSTFHVNLDLISFNIFEEGNTFFNQDLNLLNMMRLGLSKEFSGHFSLFVAPTFNVMVSQLTNVENNSVGSDIAPWTVYDKTFEGRALWANPDFKTADTNVKMWPGFQVGLRF